MIYYDSLQWYINLSFLTATLARSGLVAAEGEVLVSYMVVSLNYCSQNGGNVYRAPYYNGNPNIGPRIIGNLDQYPYVQRPRTEKPVGRRGSRFRV